MNEFEVSALMRNDSGKAATRRLRKQGLVPGILYGGGQDPQCISVKVHELRKQIENEAFFSHILTVKVDGAATQAVLKDMQRDPGSYQVTHVDFLRVKSTDRITMRVPLHFMNEEQCPARRLGGVVSHLLSDIEVTCLPRDLPEFIEVDLATLEIGQSVHLSALIMPSGVALAHAADADHDHTVVAAQEAHDLVVEPEEAEAPAVEGEAPEEA